jgi:sRNA-binding protein
MTEAELRTKWPVAFNSARLPLALGIPANAALPYPSEVLAQWTTHPKYLRNMLVPEAVRIDLEGNAVGVVTQEERECSWRALLEVRSWIYRQQRERLMNHLRARWLPFSVEDEKQEMKQRMPSFPKQK